MTQKIPTQQIPTGPDSSFDRPKIYTKLITGFYQNIRNITMYSFFVFFMILPWLKYDGRQAFWLDGAHRHFYIFGLTFMPQDFFFLSWLFIIAAFTLFAVTVFAGRVFCGYTCPQTVWTNLFMRVETFFEGERHQRVRLDKAPWTASKILRRTAKHIVWLIIAFATGATFVSFFSGTDAVFGTHVTLLGLNLRLPTFTGFQGFFLVLLSIVTYLNAGWMREQMCFMVCPYGRFQSVMFDKDTLIISYDYERGEPRGTRKKGAKIDDKGDCIDCELCVHVCPTGIDIRHGLQMECIQCAACVDACNSVMDRMGYARGLIRYTTEHQLKEHGKTHFIRPRLIGYSVLLIVMFGLLSYFLATRVPVTFDALRDRNQLFSINQETGKIENAYILKIVNKTQNVQQYHVSIISNQGLILDTKHPDIELEAGEVYSFPVTVIGDADKITTGEAPLSFHIQGITDTTLQADSKSTFKSPTEHDKEHEHD